MIDSLIEALQVNLQLEQEPQSLLRYASEIPRMGPTETVMLFDGLAEFAIANREAKWPRAMAVLLCNISDERVSDWLPDEALPNVEQLYRVCPASDGFRCRLLSLLANKDSEVGSTVWCQLICEDPPQTSENIQLAFAPFTRPRETKIDEDSLSELVENASHSLPVAAAVYELANHYFRNGAMEVHPLHDRAETLAELLGGLVGRLSKIEEGIVPEDATAESIASAVQDSVALIIAIIDALSLLEYESATGKFNQALKLRHRRIQVEAAAALARLDDEQGQKQLLELVKHPAVRPRVIAYADELGLSNEISLEHTGPIAEAESQLALWLSQPQQMGFAPTSMELVDQRELYWPSYEDPISCFLFSFEYGSGENAFHNIAISGPLTHAFTADLKVLSTADQYSAFAGWQTISDEIYTVPIDRAENLLAPQTDKLKRLLANAESIETTPQVLVSFFGEYLMVATGINEAGESGTWVVDADGNDWIGQGNESAPVDWQLALEIWKGRKLLTNFNPTFS